MFQRGFCPRGKVDYLWPPEKECVFLTIDANPVDANPVDVGDLFFEEGLYLSLFYCVWFVNNISMDMLEEQSWKERDLGIKL